MSVLSSPRVRVGSISLVLAGVLWGTGGLAGSVLASEAGLHSLAVAAYRLLLGGAAAVLFLGLTGRLRGIGGAALTKPVVRRVLVAGVLLAVFQAFYFASVTLTSVSIATMTTIGSAPVFVAIGGALVDRRWPSPATMLAIAGAVAGLVLLTWSPQETGESWALLAGVLAALVSGCGFATLTLVTRKEVAGLDPLRTTAFGCVVGGILLLPAAASFGMALPPRAEVIAVAAYLAVVPTALAYAAYFRGLRDSPAVLAALSALLEPLTAALLAAVLLGDRLGVLGWCGAALLAVSIAAGYRRPRR
ncbi:EamA family transporter [Saccharomonospora sp. NPDC006951]